MKFLFLECKSGKKACELEYSSCVAREIADKIKSKGHEVIEVKSPSPEDANRAIKKHNPDTIWWVGHGATAATSLEHVKIWIADRENCGGRWGNKNRRALKGINANALSCLTAHCLGKSLTAHYDTEWYLGYEKPFHFIWCGCSHGGCACGQYNPWDDVRDKIVKDVMSCMHESNLYYSLGLAKGYSPQEAHWFSLRRFKQWIKHWEKFEPKNKHEQSLANLANRMLRMDVKVQKLVKDGEYVSPKKPKPSPPPKPKKKLPLQPIVSTIGMGMTAVCMMKAE